ncbi:ribosomal-processing cysteine protease Prp [Desemzia sp. FAM 23991]|uniref:ribosomal-processing cysteine protease Prp n=1 Tax=unclassified Desemzia TaxID=2685243 RepID=UPI0038876FE5
MIQASIKRNDKGNIVSFEVTGHAESGPYGSDIVCAAVSALVIGTTNSLITLTGVAPIIEQNDEVEGGYLYVELIQDLTEEQLKTAQVLLESLLISLNGIAEEYSKYIQLKIKS